MECSSARKKPRLPPWAKPSLTSCNETVSSCAESLGNPLDPSSDSKTAKHETPSKIDILQESILFVEEEIAELGQTGSPASSDTLVLTETGIQATGERDSSNDHFPMDDDVNWEAVPQEGSNPGGQPSAGALHDDAATGIAEVTFDNEHHTFDEEPQDSATITRAAGNNIKHAAFSNNKSSQSQPVRRARTAQEYTENLRSKSEQDLKKDFIKQINLKRGSGVLDFVLEPPKAKRRRQQKAPVNSPGNTGDAAPSTITNPDLGGIPKSDQTKVLKKDRRKQIAAATSEGDSNRHLKSQKEDANLGMLIWGLGSVECVGSSDYRLKGIRTPIRGWQFQAATRMVLRENSHAPPYGGILGDQMGMGKTLTSLVLIVGCPPLPDDTEAGRGGTLVVVPGPNVLKEWRDAIARHTELDLQDVLVYKRSTNILQASQIARYKIVLTTYQELLKYPSGRKLSDLAKEYGQGTQEFKDAVKFVAGPVFEVEWYRVVFDELHTIKNTETQSFQACYRLNSKRIWGLSGTPLINQSKEIFPYVKLIKVEGIENKKDFECIYKKGLDAHAKLDALINLITIRRGHDDRFLGEQMLQGLPQFEAEVRWVNLSQEERLIYDAISLYFGSQSPPLPIVSMAQKRRAISHPYLLEKTFLEITDNELIQDLVDALKRIEGSTWVYHQIGRRFGRYDPDNTSAADQKDPEDVSELTPREQAYAPLKPFGKSTFGGNFYMAELLELTLMDKESGKSKCGQCNQKKKVNRMRINRCPTPNCSNTFGHYDVEPVSTLVKKAMTCASSDDEPTDEDSDDNRPRSRKSKVAEKRRKAQARREKKMMRRRKYGSDYIGNLPVLEEDDSSFLHIGVNRNGDGVPCPGTKLTVTKEIVLQWQKEAPNDKIIIFVEFIKTAVLLGIVLNLEGIPFVYLNGKLTSTEKLKAVETFKTKPQVKILVSQPPPPLTEAEFKTGMLTCGILPPQIASMKVGGQALNLTCANRVIQVDSWWNEAAGDQANGRVNRMGQLKPSHAVVIKARGTIDEHITDLQNRKTEEIEHILQDNGRVTEVLSEYEVMALTAPVAWQELKQRVIDDIEEEMGPQGIQ
ncbi:putative SNF2 family domain-containing protein [Colletotrichum sublineola]|uniref:Putative SNF2 family domain-containing protein n=1 Tax=Colletotrichum sublineola TaxID=1173701 RepID=A0A066XMW7_COLSU|nr:putative SNF2 family domain-containing protein [Colletotrichum sublineola]